MYTGQGNRTPEIDAIEHDVLSQAKRSLILGLNDAGNAWIGPTIFDYVSSNPLAVVLVDTAGAPYVAGGGGGGPAANVSAYISGTISLPVYVFTSTTLNALVAGTITANVAGNVTSYIGVAHDVTAYISASSVYSVTARIAASVTLRAIIGSDPLAPPDVDIVSAVTLNAVVGGTVTANIIGNVTCFHPAYQHLSYTTTNFLVTLHTTGPTLVCATNLTRAAIEISYRTNAVTHVFIGGTSNASGEGYYNVLSQSAFRSSGPEVYVGALHGTTTLDNSVVHVFERMWST